MSESLSDDLLIWYDRHARRLPWRSPPGLGDTDPYQVWLSEVMLQQTTVVAVMPYFTSFLERWPSVHDLAAAPLDDVLTAWAGLGYYARARNLHRCARVVAEEMDGKFPEDEAELLKLPGVGPYTAAAVSAIAFDKPAVVVDGNVERVVARLFALQVPLPQAKTEIKERARQLTPRTRPGDYAQAMMDLGATICLPRTPKCLLCPLSGHCRAQRLGKPAEFPKKAAKPERPTRYGVAFFVTRGDGAILLRRRPEKGLLGGMMEVPSSPWREEAWEREEALQFAPLEADWRRSDGPVRHTFTHFRLEMVLWLGRLGDTLEACRDVQAGRWVLPERLDEEALPSLMRKMIRKGLSG